MGHWHAQVTKLTIRLYDNVDGYEKRVKFRASAQVDLLGDHHAFIHGMLSDPNRPISKREWLAVRELLRKDWNVKTILAERGNEMVKFETGFGDL